MWDPCDPQYVNSCQGWRQLLCFMTVRYIITFCILFQHSVNDLQSQNIPELLQAIPTVKIRQKKCYDLSKKYSKARYMYVMYNDAHQFRNVS